MLFFHPPDAVFADAVMVSHRSAIFERHFHHDTPDSFVDALCFVDVGGWKRAELKIDVRAVDIAVRRVSGEKDDLRDFVVDALHRFLVDVGDDVPIGSDFKRVDQDTARTVFLVFIRRVVAMDVPEIERFFSCGYGTVRLCDFIDDDAFCFGDLLPPLRPEQ